MSGMTIREGLDVAPAEGLDGLDMYNGNTYEA